jgi:hypothetical protein
MVCVAELILVSYEQFIFFPQLYWTQGRIYRGDAGGAHPT